MQAFSNTYSDFHMRQTADTNQNSQRDTPIKDS